MTRRISLALLLAAGVAAAALVPLLALGLGDSEPSSPQFLGPRQASPVPASSAIPPPATTFCVSVPFTRQDAQTNLDSMLAQWNELPPWYRALDRLLGFDDPDSLNWKDIEEAQRRLDEMPPEGLDMQIEVISVGAGPEQALPPGASRGPCPTPSSSP